MAGQTMLTMTENVGAPVPQAPVPSQPANGGKPGKKLFGGKLFGGKSASSNATPTVPGQKKSLLKMEFSFKNLNLPKVKLPPNLTRGSKNLEINLVPDVKGEMIKALKLRNIIFFVCIVVAIASVAVTAIFGSIAGGQQVAVNNRKDTLTALSNKVNSYSDLSDFLTIKDQLGNLKTIADNKQVLSRTFGILSALLPTGADTITLSELSINLSGEEPTFTFDAQANAGTEPYIDYNVLDAFKKSMQYMRYDYGTYVDKDGEAIPAYCILESGTDGARFSDESRGYYALWLITGEGCYAGAEELDEDEEPVNLTEAEQVRAWGYTPEEYDGQTVVRIWRTPQYNLWYKAENMDLYGAISGVAHFESECTSYSGVENDDGTVSWSETNNACLLVPDGIDGIKISDSSNGRGANEELVLRFSAVITLNPDVYKFSNTHVMAVPPSGRYNVTDSYVQIQNMFSERAADCAPGDTACNSARTGD